MPDTPTTIQGPTPDSPQIAIARLGVVTRRSDEVSDWIDVQFNPASLQLQVSNELKDTRNNERKQYIAKSNAKLTMELQYDTTDTGEDVTSLTRRLQGFIAPPLPARQRDRQNEPPPVVRFEWGRIKFQGITETYKETIDFFSANGVPLRSTVNLTLSRQDQVFDDAPAGAPDDAGLADDDAIDTAGSAADVANAGDAPGSARSLAASNGLESLRFGIGAQLTVGAELTLRPPAAFTAASGGLGLGLGGGLNLGAGLAAGVGGGVDLPAHSGAGVSSLSKLSATEGAFAALRATTGTVMSAARVNTARLVPQVRSSSLATDRNASFQVGGRARLEGASGLRADVGAASGMKRLTFDGS
jgi:hypothetical protein